MTLGQAAGCYCTAGDVEAVIEHAIELHWPNGSAVFASLLASVESLIGEWEGYRRIGCGRRHDVLAVYLPRVACHMAALDVLRVVAVMDLLATVVDVRP